MLAKLNVDYVIVGHSERRALFGENDAVVAAKAAAVFGCEMTPIVCVGETLEERESDQAESVVETQIRGSLASISGEKLDELVIAYEPVWAIGTGLTATPDDVAEVHGFIRDRLRRRFKAEGAGMRILYGGSVKPGNAAELMAVADVDGALVGGASLTAADFWPIVKTCL